MLTDMTPTAGQFYGAQIPAMTMNVKTAVSILQKPILFSFKQLFIIKNLKDKPDQKWSLVIMKCVK